MNDDLVGPATVEVVNKYLRLLHGLAHDPNRQQLAYELHLTVSVCHVPPGASKWNKIEYRMCCHFTENWRGRPLTSRAVIVNLIGHAGTEAGPKIHAALDQRGYADGIKVTRRGPTRSGYRAMPSTANALLNRPSTRMTLLELFCGNGLTLQRSFDSRPLMHTTRPQRHEATRRWPGEQSARSNKLPTS